MKRYIRSSTNPYSIGDTVTTNLTYGYAPYDSKVIDVTVNRNGKDCVVLDDGKEIPVGGYGMCKSKKAELNSLTIEDITTPEFISSLSADTNDSIWCKENWGRVDRDRSIENTVGIKSVIMPIRRGYKVVIDHAISKHGNITTDTELEYPTDINDPIISEAIDILKSANEIVLNYGFYQRVFKR